MRPDGRKNHELRKISVRQGYLKNALGSCMIEMGETRLVCSATVEDKIPPFLRNKGKGWVTAEYGMIPASCAERVAREATKGRPSGRTQEIQRLIGRSLRAVVDLTKLGERTIWIDADVLQADGGTRTAAITGGFLALAEALKKLKMSALLTESPILDCVAAVSIGIIDGRPVLDLCYEEDARAEVDMNVVMTGSGHFVEIQGTAEGKPFNGRQMGGLLSLARRGIRELIRLQHKYA